MLCSYRYNILTPFFAQLMVSGVHGMTGVPAPTRVKVVSNQDQRTVSILIQPAKEKLVVLILTKSMKRNLKLVQITFQASFIQSRVGGMLAVETNWRVGCLYLAKEGQGDKIKAFLIHKPTHVYICFLNTTGILKGSIFITYMSHAFFYFLAFAVFVVSIISIKKYLELKGSVVIA